MTDLLRVMVVDEDLDSRLETRKALQRAELEVVGESGFGNEAVSLAREVRPDLLLVAVEEPASRPLDTADALANALPETPIIIYSSQSTAEAVRRGMVFGARDYLTRPVRSDTLRASIERALGQEERRQMRRAGQLADEVGRATVITVTGAKGGIGKTVISVNLAIALRQATGKKVAIIDADTSFGDVATFLDLAPTTSIADLMRRGPALSRDEVQQYVTTHVSGVDAIPAPVSGDIWQEAEPEELRAVVEVAAQIYDFVVIDTSGAFDRMVRTCIEASTMTLVVTSTDVSSVRSTAAAIRRLQDWGVPADRTRYAVNMGTRTNGITAAELGEAIGREILWELPYDKVVPESVQYGRPLVLDAPRSKAALSVVALANSIAGTNQHQSTAPDDEPLWRRVVPVPWRQRDGAEREAVSDGARQ